MPRRASMLALLAALLLVPGCGSSTRSSTPSTTPGIVPPAPIPATGAAPWPSPPDPLGLARAAGLTPETHETLQHHVHAHLDVYVNGRPEPVPAGIGIEINDPAVKRSVADGQPTYGGISVPCAQPCISPLHTHDVSGVIHTESATDVDHTLGQLFIEWGVKLDANCVGGYCLPQSAIAIYVNGRSVALDAAPAIALTDRKEIAVVVGTPPDHVPARAFSQS